ncbi:MAG: CAP domain-containing protein [Neisseriaceae bacterium]|nr:CAP domain-containing protein [Neisseriaceae bacterium]
MLETHNQARQEVNVPPVKWNDLLAEEAQGWADYLAQNHKFEHSTNRNGHGENLWQGQVGVYFLAKPVESWVDEKKYFVYGRFPNVSNTGKWQDVGHYTQVVWKNTKEIGCAHASNEQHTLVVCRYNPPGNYRNQKPF